MADNKPVHEIRIGRLCATIWQNETHEGTPMHNVTFSRLYKDDDQWKNSTSFGRDDLLTLGKLADITHSWIHEQCVDCLSKDS